MNFGWTVPIFTLPVPNLIPLRTHVADELEVCVVAASAEHRGVVHLKTEEGVKER